MYVALTDQELDALRGTDYALTVLYVYIKQFMDYKTGIVGHARRISYQAMSEALYIEPRQGVKGGSPHISSIRRMIDQLLKVGILRKGRNDTLVFKLPYADTENHVQNKADRKSTPQADRPKANTGAELDQQADRPKKAKADIPHLSLNTINKPTSSSIGNSVSDQKKDDDELLIFHKSLHADVTESMKNQLAGFQHERQQEILDELSFYISKNKISVSPMSLFMAMVKGAKAGTFIAANANSVRKARENLKASVIEKTKPAPTAAEKEANKEKGRAAMSNVKQLFKRGATA
jgi:hypothetical protein